MDEIHGGSALGQAVGNTVDMIVTMGRLLMGGVCERFPRLKLVFLESSGGWVPVGARADGRAGAGVPAREALAVAAAERVLRAAVLRELRAGGVEPRGVRPSGSAPTGSCGRRDYPHPEYHPGVVDELREHIAPLSEPDRARVLAGNAIDCYGL